MAKALIAAVALALVLVAAVVVPTVVTPGVYGFNDWPTAKAQAPREQVVSLDAPVQRTALAEPRPSRIVTSKPRVAPPAPAPHKQPVQAAPVPIEPQQPKAAPEAPPTPPVVDARGNSLAVPTAVAGQVQTTVEPDGTNLP